MCIEVEPAGLHPHSCNHRFLRRHDTAVLDMSYEEVRGAFVEADSASRRFNDRCRGLSEQVADFARQNGGSHRGLDAGMAIALVISPFRRKTIDLRRWGQVVANLGRIRYTLDGVHVACNRPRYFNANSMLFSSRGEFCRVEFVADDAGISGRRLWCQGAWLWRAIQLLEAEGLRAPWFVGGAILNSGDAKLEGRAMEPSRSLALLPTIALEQSPGDIKDMMLATHLLWHSIWHAYGHGECLFGEHDFNLLERELL